MAACPEWMKRRNAQAREYADLHASQVADFAALYDFGDRLQAAYSRRLGGVVVPLYEILAGYQASAADDDWGGFAKALSERLLERSYRSAYRGMMSEFGGEFPADPRDPDDAMGICDLLGRLPVPGVQGLAILTRLVDSIPGAMGFNERPARIMPSRLAMVSGGAARVDARRSSPLFSAAMHVERRNGREFVLPGFGPERENCEGPVLPLEFYELGISRGNRHTGQGVPRVQRLWVELVLLESDDRPFDGSEGPIRSMRYGELLRRMYPNRMPRPSECWPAMVEAVDALSSQAARIPVVDPVTGVGTARPVVLVRAFARAAHALDDLVEWSVRFPPRSGPGPLISPNLAYFGLRSPPKFYALLSLPFHWYRPGITRVPVSARGRRYWVPSQNPRVYPCMDDDDLLISACFPVSANRHRRNLRLRAREAIKELVDAGEIRLVNGHLLPPQWYGRADLQVPS